MKTLESNVCGLAVKRKEATGERSRGSSRNIYRQQLKNLWVSAVNDLP